MAIARCEMSLMCRSALVSSTASRRRSSGAIIQICTEYVVRRWPRRLVRSRLYEQQQR